MIIDETYSNGNFIKPNPSEGSKRPFNKLRIVAEARKENIIIPVENPVPEDIINTIFCKSSEIMEELPDCSVHFMLTSPPYSSGQVYDLDLSLTEYLDMLRRVLGETYRVLVPGGRAAINVAGLGRKPYIPLQSHVMFLAMEIGFLPRGEIIWAKGRGKNGSCAWGSWMSAANPTIRDIHEYVLVFSKDSFKRSKAGISTISKEEFCSSTLSIWEIRPESPRRVSHPTPFPEQLAERLIHLYSFRDDVVLDPFIGRGTTAVAALLNGRSFVGYEWVAEYARVAEARVANIRNSEALRS